MEWERIGNCAVDAGIIMLGDPCYYLHGENPEVFGSTWPEFCDRLRDELTLDLDSYAVVVSSGYGDGVYPVEAKFEDGRVKEVRIVFF